MVAVRQDAPAAVDRGPARARPRHCPCPASHFVNGAPLRPPYPDGLELALFGLGCFWGAERKFWQAPGVFSTAVGYAGGFTPNPTYEEVCSGRTGHTEVVRVVFDPAQTSYDALLRLFWESHDPTQGMRQGNDVGTQYRSAIYTYGDEQRRRAEASRDAYQPALAAGRARRDHHRDRRGARLLLRRGLSPAVPRRRTRTATAGSAAPACRARSEWPPRADPPRPSFLLERPAALGYGSRGAVSARARARGGCP